MAITCTQSQKARGLAAAMLVELDLLHVSFPPLAVAYKTTPMRCVFLTIAPGHQVFLRLFFINPLFLRNGWNTILAKLPCLFVADP